MQLGLCPRARIVPTSRDEAGQIYVPTANWLLMAGTLLVVVLFKTSSNLAGAYGVAVSGTMLVTTILLYRVAIGRWQWSPAAAILMVVVFGAIDSIFLASNSLKIVDGGWFSLAVGGAMAGLMLCWRRGASEVRHRAQEKSMPLEQFVDKIDTMVVARPPGMGVWLTKLAHDASPMLLHHVKHDRVMHQTVILMTIVADRRPRVPFGERHSMETSATAFIVSGLGWASCRRRTFPWRSGIAGCWAPMPIPPRCTITSLTKSSFAAQKIRRWRRCRSRSSRS